MLRSLRALNAFEHCSPYISAYVDGPGFYRSSAVGFIQSKNLDPTERSACVSLSQFLDRLRVLPEDKVEISLDDAGVLVLSSVDNTWSNELRVHTVKPEQAGLKTHLIGDIKLRLDPLLFQGFSAKPFDVVSFPTLSHGTLMLPTVNGIVTWVGPEALSKISIQPRDEFLKFLSPTVQEISLTDKGYWGATNETLLSFVGAHSGADALFKMYDVPGTKLVTFPADRLCFALNAASAITNGNLEITGTEVKVKDAHGLSSKFGVGGDGTAKFTISSKTAKLIVDAFEQTRDEQAVLYSIVVGSHATMRLERGRWAVNFKVF